MAKDYFPLKKGDKLIVVVPHYDDLVLGCGDFILEAVDKGLLTTVTSTYVCFSRTNYFSNYQKSALADEQVYRASISRLTEDTFALNKIFNGWSNWKQSIMGEFDASLRKHCVSDRVGGFRKGSSTFEEDDLEVIKSLSQQFRWMFEQENTVVVGLCANGCHIDHIITREALFDAAYKSSGKVTSRLILTEDEPYTVASDSVETLEMERLIKTLAPHCSVHQIPVKMNQGKSVIHDIFNFNYMTQWSSYFEDNLSKRKKFRFMVIENISYPMLHMVKDLIL
ncbi:hypothetical protein [Aeromonas salmonicida]